MLNDSENINMIFNQDWLRGCYVGNDASIEIKRSVISVLTQQLFWIVQSKLMIKI
jgi:hypothetical protein